SGCASMRASATSSASCQVIPIPLIPLDSTPYCRGRLAFGCGSPNLFRDLHHDIAAHDGLTAEPRVERQPLRRVEAVFLVLLHRREVLLAFTYDDVTGGAGAAAAAVVLEVDAFGQRDVEQGAGPAVVGQRVLAVIHLDRDVEGQKGHRVGGHHFCSRIWSARFEVMAPLTAASIIASARRSV